MFFNMKTIDIEGQWTINRNKTIDIEGQWTINRNKTMFLACSTENF